MMGHRMHATVCFIDRTQFGKVSRLKSAVGAIQSTLHGSPNKGQAASSASESTLPPGVAIRAPHYPLGERKVGAGKRATDRTHENEANSIRHTINLLLHGSQSSEHGAMAIYGSSVGEVPV
jgi:hypothetical protein